MDPVVEVECISLSPLEQVALHYTLHLGALSLQGIKVFNPTRTHSPLRFADVLADNGRLPITADVIAAFGKMMSAHRGEVICTVTTAQV